MSKPFERAAAALTDAVLRAADAGRADFEAQVAKLRADAASSSDNLAGLAELVREDQRASLVRAPMTSEQPIGPEGGMTEDTGTWTVRLDRELLATMMVGIPVGSLSLAEAARFQTAMTYGRVAGLSDEESRQVVDAWRRHHQARLSALDWDVVERSMVLRAMGEDWRP